MRTMIRRRLRPLVPIAATVALAACGSDALPTTAPATTGATAAACASPAATSETDTFSTPVTLTTTADGLQYGDITAGAGTMVAKGEKLTVEYTGWLSSGTVFDSSRKAGRAPFSFVIGANPANVIQGWEEGLLTMKVGGKRRLVIPPSLGYGAQAQGTIPANSTLTFDVELLGACPG